MRKFFKFDNRGLTLIELLVTMTIASLVIVAIATFLVNTIRYNAMAQDEVYIQDQVRYAMKGITNFAMEKTTATVKKGPPSTVTFNPGNSIIKLSGKDLMHDSEVLAKDIESFTAKMIDSKLIEVTIEGKKNEAHFKVTDHIYLRN